MAKNERMVTRTIKDNAVSLKVYNLDTDNIETCELHITGNFANDELVKRCENRLSGANVKVLKILDVATTEKLYAMPESTFLLYAVEIPPRQGKENEEEEG